MRKQMTYDLRLLTNSQLRHLHLKIWDRIERAFAGGLRYGIDWPTLLACEPGLADCLRSVKNEILRRLHS